MRKSSVTARGLRLPNGTFLALIFHFCLLPPSFPPAWDHSCHFSSLLVHLCVLLMRCSLLVDGCWPLAPAPLPALSSVMNGEGVPTWVKTGSGVNGMKSLGMKIWLESLIYDSYKWYFLMGVRFRNVPKLLNLSSFNAIVSVVVLSAFCFTFVFFLFTLAPRQILRHRNFLATDKLAAGSQRQET